MSVRKQIRSRDESSIGPRADEVRNKSFFFPQKTIRRKKKRKNNVGSHRGKKRLGNTAMTQSSKSCGDGSFGGGGANVRTKITPCTLVEQLRRWKISLDTLSQCSLRRFDISPGTSTLSFDSIFSRTPLPGESFRMTAKLDTTKIHRATRSWHERFISLFESFVYIYIYPAQWEIS